MAVLSPVGANLTRRTDFVEGICRLKDAASNVGDRREGGHNEGNKWGSDFRERGWLTRATYESG